MIRIRKIKKGRKRWEKKLDTKTVSEEELTYVNVNIEHIYIFGMSTDPKILCICLCIWINFFLLFPLYLFAKLFELLTIRDKLQISILQWSFTKKIKANKIKIQLLLRLPIYLHESSKGVQYCQECRIVVCCSVTVHDNQKDIRFKVFLAGEKAIEMWRLIKSLSQNG